jgi:hypothetical protein
LPVYDQCAQAQARLDPYRHTGLRQLAHRIEVPIAKTRSLRRAVDHYDNTLAPQPAVGFDQGRGDRITKARSAEQDPVSGVADAEREARVVNSLECRH